MSNPAKSDLEFDVRSQRALLMGKFVRVARVELAIFCSQSRRLTNKPSPGCFVRAGGVGPPFMTSKITVLPLDDTRSLLGERRDSNPF